MTKPVICAWDDDGFAKERCFATEEQHCLMKGVDDTCTLVHHPWTPGQRCDDCGGLGVVVARVMGVARILSDPERSCPTCNGLGVVTL